MFKYTVFLLTTFLSSVINEVISCQQNNKAADCAELFKNGCNKSGVYTIRLTSRVTGNKEVSVFCDMTTDGGGWTIIQRRGNYSRPSDYFYKDWESYKEGFGDMAKSYYFGGDNIFALTNLKPTTLRVDVTDFKKNKVYAQYDSFWIDDEFNNYTLHLLDYSGDAGDSLYYHNLEKFSTKDRDNDKSLDENCAVKHKGAWWYSRCLQSNLNGLYLKESAGTTDGIIWNTWKGMKTSLFSTEMKVRPQNFM